MRPIQHICLSPTAALTELVPSNLSKTEKSRVITRACNF